MVGQHDELVVRRASPALAEGSAMVGAHQLKRVKPPRESSQGLRDERALQARSTQALNGCLFLG